MAAEARKADSAHLSELAPSYSNDGVISAYMLDDMGAEDLLALFVLDDIPIETLNAILDDNAEHISGNDVLWLADSYDTLPNYRGKVEPGTCTPIDLKWESPFIGKTIPDVVAFLRATPKPPKPFNKRYCAALTQESLDDGLILICKSVESDSESIESEIDEDSGRRNLWQVVRELGNDYEDIQVIPVELDKVGECFLT